jgi:cytoskeleton protein RodZ
MMPLSGIRPIEVEGRRVVESALENESPAIEEFKFHTVGEQLKAEREVQALTLPDLAARTRIPMRHLEAIEKSDFSALPGTTYTLGFARSYAQALGLDSAKISRDMREELAQGGHESYRAPTPNYEPTDPSRVPSKLLAWVAAGIGILLVAAYLLWRSYSISEPDIAPVIEQPITATSATDAAPAAVTPTANANGQVVLTAKDTVWVKIYDADNKRLFENEMKPGEQYRVPQDANKPMIVTGRPNVIDVSIDGKPVAPLGPPEKTVVDVVISAAALSTRTPETATTNDAGAAPATTQSSTPTTN